MIIPMHPKTLSIQLPTDSIESVEVSFVLLPECPAGFLMGSKDRYSRDSPSNESPRHIVIIPRSFYLGIFPVTQEQFACFRPEHRSSNLGKPRHPVEQISWDDASAFVEWLNEGDKLPDGYLARLPCEAEWEYACRAGADTEYWNGDGEGALRQVGWFKGNSGETTHRVGEQPCNPWGLFDMHGNVLEWCDDVYDDKAYSKRGAPWVARAWSERDAGGDAGRFGGDLPDRVMRGGCWRFSSEWNRAAARLAGHPGNRNAERGFRVLIVPPW
jgi:formylglycine-generating enzyme required for sulfatase activity